MKHVTMQKVLLSLQTILLMALITILIVACSGCSLTDIEDSYSHTADDLLNKNFYSMDEALKDGTPRVRIMFSNPDFKIEEDNYATTPGGGSQYLHTLNIFGSITHKYNTDDFQVIEFYINNFTGPGYKYYRIKDGSYNGISCLKLVEMKQQQYVTSSGGYAMEWVEWWHGDVTYLQEY